MYVKFSSFIFQVFLNIILGKYNCFILIYLD